jgi:hypothetical protein
MATDAFGRLRVSNPLTTFDYYPSPLSANTNLDGDAWVTTYNSTNEPSYDLQNFIKMENTSGSNNYCLRQTKFPMVYQSGKGRLLFMTGVAMMSTAENTSYIGLFNVNNNTIPEIIEGVYFKTDGTYLWWEEVTQDNTVTSIQSSWNIDIFDGNGPSGKTITQSDLNKAMIWTIDQEWLGVGRIRCGFIIDGIIYYAHAFTHDSINVQYTKTPRLRLSYYIKGTTENSMRQMCSASICEGGYHYFGRRNSVSNGTSLVKFDDTTKNIMLALRINTNYTHATFMPIKMSIYNNASSKEFIYYEVQMHSTNGTVGNVTTPSQTWTAVNDSAAEYYVGTGDDAYVSTDGYIIASGYSESRADINFSLTPEELTQPRLIFTQYDTLIIIVKGSANKSACASIDFIEQI